MFCIGTFLQIEDFQGRLPYMQGSYIQVNMVYHCKKKKKKGHQTKRIQTMIQQITVHVLQGLVYYINLFVSFLNIHTYYEL